MKKLKLMMAVLFLILVAGCAQETEVDSPFQLYFVVEGSDIHGDAIQGTPYLYEGEGEPSAYELLNALLAGPTEDGFVNPFPAGTGLRWFGEGENGIMDISVSEEYNGLTGISHTLADYCIAMTLSQLDGIEAVNITAVGQPANDHIHGVLRRGDMLPVTYLGVDGAISGT